jgi:hypothetical protein
VSNSDAFAHLRQHRASRVERTFIAAERRVHSGLADHKRVLAAFAAEERAPGSGLAGGGRGSDVADPTGNQALRHDWADALRSRYDLAIAELEHCTREIIAIAQQVIFEPTPTGLCRDGACPDTKMADRGKTMRGTARCHACYWYWINDHSNPDQRDERPEIGATPRRIGLGKPAEADAVA